VNQRSLKRNPKISNDFSLQKNKQVATLVVAQPDTVNAERQLELIRIDE
jgi:hypothetical protein